LTGPNGAGKTNLLEAVSLLVPGRGLRHARLDDLPRCSDPGHGWAVAATVASPEGPVELGTGRNGAEDSRRSVRVNGNAAPSQAALADYLSMVWLTPQMDRLFLEGAPGRRRFLDRLVFGFDSTHVGRVNGYEHALRERARLLRGPRPDPVWLETLERTMAERGVAVAAARREMTARLARICTTPPGPFPGAEIAVDGTIEGWLDMGPALAAEERFRTALRECREHDAESGGAAIGPHRSDLAVRHLSSGMPADQCSTGEQKALLIAIVLAHTRLQAAERGHAPILLFDEVAAHLDDTKRKALFDELLALGGQAWLTGTDRALFAPLEGHAQFFMVRDGALQPESAPAPTPASKKDGWMYPEYSIDGTREELNER
jgi:DNA replication and repair protein RecF